MALTTGPCSGHRSVSPLSRPLVSCSFCSRCGFLVGTPRVDSAVFTNSRCESSPCTNDFPRGTVCTLGGEGGVADCVSHWTRKTNTPCCYVVFDALQVLQRPNCSVFVGILAFEVSLQMSGGVWVKIIGRSFCIPRSEKLSSSVWVTSCLSTLKPILGAGAGEGGGLCPGNLTLILTSLLHSLLGPQGGYTVTLNKYNNSHIATVCWRFVCRCRAEPFTYM